MAALAESQITKRVLTASASAAQPSSSCSVGSVLAFNEGVEDCGFSS